jgi:hypothetical protein
MWWLLYVVGFATAQPAAPLLSFNLSLPLEPVSPSLFGLNLEFTRHDLFAGLSAQLLANRLFTLQPPGTTWPQPINWGSTWPPRWTPIGAVAVCPPAPPAVTSSCMRCILRAGDGPCGLRQGTVLDGFGSGYGSFGSAIGLQAGVAYSLVVYATANSSLSLFVNVSGVVARTLPLAGSGQLERLEVNFTFPGPTTPGATLELSFTGAAAPTNATFVASSLLPSDNFFGMRRDVVAALKALNFSGPLRYPGGCFAPFYRWRDGLLPMELRPVIQTPPDYCQAVRGGVNAYTDGFLENGPSTDEYIALCREIGAMPVITLALQFGTDEEVESARSWAEYTNGPPSSPFGALRAARRGTGEPYNVTLWYIGNEINAQARFPDYPSQPAAREGGCSGAEYAAIVAKIVGALHAVDPTIAFSAVDGGGQFDRPWVEAWGPNISFTSYHGGYAQGPLSTPEDYTACAQAERAGFLPGLLALRALLDGVGAAHVKISADEWGWGPPWVVPRFSTAHAMYGASLLSLVVSSAQSQGLAYSNYFEPINEGAIAVEQFSVSLTPLGVLMPLLSQHGAGRRVEAAPLLPTPYILPMATLHAAPQAQPPSLLLTLVNRNATQAFVQPLALLGYSAPPATASVRVLAATGPTADSVFVASDTTAPVSAAGELRVVCPAYSVVQVRVLL